MFIFGWTSTNRSHPFFPLFAWCIIERIIRKRGVDQLEWDGVGDLDGGDVHHDDGLLVEQAAIVQPWNRTWRRLLFFRESGRGSISQIFSINGLAKAKQIPEYNKQYWLTKM